MCILFNCSTVQIQIFGRGMGWHFEEVYFAVFFPMEYFSSHVRTGDRWLRPAATRFRMF